MKFYGVVEYNPGTNRLDFGGNPVLDPDLGIFEEILLYYCDIGNNVKAPRRRFGNQSQNSQLSDLRSRPPTL